MRWAVVVALAGCHARLADDDTAAIDAARPSLVDAALGADAPPADAAALGPWSAPMKVPGASTAGASEDDETMAWTGGELVFAVQEGGTKRLYTMTHAGGGFGTPALLPFSGGLADDESPRFSPDDLNLYFASNRGASGSLDIYTVHRNTVGGPWGSPALVAGPNTNRTEKWYAPCSTGYYLMIGTTGTDTDVFEGSGATPPTRVASLSSASSETGTYLSRDCLTAYFASTRGGDVDLYVSTRGAITDPWPAAAKVTDFDTAAGNEEDPWLSSDGRTFLFARAPAADPNAKDVYISTR